MTQSRKISPTPDTMSSPSPEKQADLAHESLMAERIVKPFALTSDYEPAGDQPTAIAELIEGIKAGKRDQVLLGVTGSGKTFTIAQVIQNVQRPTLIMAHNKTLAAQLYQEMKSFFPDNAVEYFVSYYDYYQPEAYVPASDTFIEKDSSVNEQIDRLRHSATRALLERTDVIIVSSVSCLYGIGSLENYTGMVVSLSEGEEHVPQDICRELVNLQYVRSDASFTRGQFRLRGDLLEIFPAHFEDRAWRISFFDREIESITEYDPLTGENFGRLDQIRVFANSHYVTPGPTIKQAVKSIRAELAERLAELEVANDLLAKQRIDQRTTFDLEMLETAGFCSGIENYSRHLTARPAGMPPPTLFEYLPDDALLVVDESHVTVPQIGGMYRGDFARKSTLSQYGFRLPSCVDNRPLKFEEWQEMRPQTVFVSATPGPWEQERTAGVITEQVIRPTGLIDPECLLRPCEGQVDDLLAECREVVATGRVLVTTLTKKMAELLTKYMEEAGLRVRYLHSDVETLERIEIIRDLRLGAFDILVGINLLREGLDIPECKLVAILDADKEGFLRSRTSLIQTIGRAARNVEGRVVLYADKMTDSLQYALDETSRRRAKQQAYNHRHGITPQSVRSHIGEVLQTDYEKDRALIAIHDEMPHLDGLTLNEYLSQLRKTMLKAADELDFETAAKLRDELKRLETYDLTDPAASAPLNKKIAQDIGKGAEQILQSRYKEKAKRKKRTKPRKIRLSG